MVNQTAAPRTRATQKASTHRAVLAAARDEFERVGFADANLRAIAARAGVSAGTVLHHFGEKRDLLCAALFDDLTATLARETTRPSRGRLEHRLSTLARGVYDFYRARPGLSRTFLKESLFAEGDWARRFIGQTSEVASTVTAWVDTAKSRDELRDDTDSRLVAAAWLSFFYFGLLSWAQGAVEEPARLVATLTHQHLRGLAPAASKERRSR